MELLLTYLSTILLSYGVEGITMLQVYKDIADAGYKVSGKRVNEERKNVTEEDNTTDNDKLFHLIPIFNIFYAMNKGINYAQVRGRVVENLYYSGILDEMSEIEKEKYAKHPTAINSIFISIKSQIKLSKASIISVRTGIYQGDIYYNASNDLEEITILKVTGSLNRLSEEEQKEKVREVIIGFAESVMRQYFESKEFDDMLNSGEGFVVEKVMEDGKVVEMSNEEKKKVLENLKQDLLGEKESIEYSDGPTLTHKRKDEYDGRNL